MTGRKLRACLIITLTLIAGCNDNGEREPAPPTAVAAGTEPAGNTSAPTPPSVRNPTLTPTPPSMYYPRPHLQCPGGSLDTDDFYIGLKPPPAPTARPTPVDPAAGVGDRFYPLMGNRGYDVIHYDISLDVEPTTNTIDAVTTLTAVATENLTRFNLDFHGLDVTAVTVDGTEARFTRDGNEMTIRPVAPITAGARFSAAISYSGTPQPVDDPGVPAPLGWQWAKGVIFTSSEPSGAMTWYPSNNHPTDKATFTFKITVPDGVTAAASGVLTDETSSNGRTTTTWKMEDPMATYLAAIYIGDFERHEKRLANGLLIRDYVHPDSDTVVLHQLALTPRAVSFLEEILGPYPFDAYGTIVMPFTLGWAMENQTLSIHGCLDLDPYVIAHELAHQWVGNSSTVDNWDQIWLHEGFAHYLGRLFMADYYELDINDLMADEHYELALAGTSPPAAIEIHELFDSHTIYQRGAQTLHALRASVGNEVFFSILRTHYDQTAGGTTNTEIFLDVVNRLAGPEAVSLVRSWLYDADMPDLVNPGNNGETGEAGDTGDAQT
ncbi:M1 family metallopeptidase [Candidatus Poriferisocius sp.]|uniref:M1 family metallopeptidase n=1 Tax=Candidatus Poriferisocius sp. TaxID=3101276 RepID=UPI003B01FAB4